MPMTPVPSSTTRPTHRRADGVRRSSSAARSVASVKKCAAVSNDIFRNGEHEDSMPMRLHAR